MNHPMLLLYNLNGPNSAKIKLLCVKLGIKVRQVEKHEYGLQLATLAGMSKEAPVPYGGEGFTEEMMILVSFPNDLLEEFLKGFRAAKIPPVPLKAVLTPTNAFWNSLQLHDELIKEHEAINKAKLNPKAN